MRSISTALATGGLALTLGIGIGIGSGTPAACADVLFTNLGAGNSYNVVANGGITGFDLAIGFTVAGTGTFTLTSLELPISQLGTPGASTTFSLASVGVGNVPGASLGTLGTFTNLPAFGNPAPLSVFNVSAAGVTVTGGSSYFLVEDASPSSNIVINQNNIGAFGMAFRDSDAQPWSYSSGSRTSAVRINGTPTSVTAAVPEPSEWLAMGMAGTSVMGLMVRARRRKVVKTGTTIA
ncbi:MAG: PEP-CTERM sorting domain-containing protein [Armatimonadota bacterium]